VIDNFRLICRKSEKLTYPLEKVRVMGASLAILSSGLRSSSKSPSLAAAKIPKGVIEELKVRMGAEPEFCATIVLEKIVKNQPNFEK
jgi:hypothetical protein